MCPRFFLKPLTLAIDMQNRVCIVGIVGRQRWRNDESLNYARNSTKKRPRFFTD
jgi:hypothetical protein